MKTAALALSFALGAAGAAGAADSTRSPAVEPEHAQGPRPEAQRVEAQHAHGEGVPRVEAVRRPGEPQRIRTCFNAAETREKVLSRRLSEPFHLLRGAAGRVQGEALRAKLCRWNEEYVYEIALLRRDGHVVHVYLNAVSGQSVAAFDER